MKKNYICLVLFLAIFTKVFSQVTATASWESGDDTPDQSGLYGTKGVGSVTNKPGARESAVSWTDNADNLWLMGGNGNSTSSGGAGYLNDLWKYDPVTNEWTWVSGDQTPFQDGIYGTKGVGSVANKPGGRKGAVSWTDPGGNLWLMGGAHLNSISGAGLLNDLWKYNPATNEWTWVSGHDDINQAGVYGTKGVASATNLPGARFGAVSWTDNTGNLWLMGGLGFSSSGQGHLNDLWKFYPATNEWTWVSGDNIHNQPGIYGTKGTESTCYQPGSRFEAVSWTGSTGNLWVMGGNGYSADELGRLNDLWKFSIWPSDPNDLDKDGIGDACDPVVNVGGAVNSLKTDLQAMNIPADLKQSLIDKLIAAEAKCAAGNTNAAKRQLNAFILQVSAKKDKDLTAAQADDLINRATALINAIENGTADCGGSAATPAARKAISLQDKPEIQYLTVKAMPNPSNHYFTLFAQSSNSQPITVKVIDMLGRVIETDLMIPANGTLTLGHRYHPSMYLIELLQGNQRVLVKLIKQAY